MNSLMDLERSITPVRKRQSPRSAGMTKRRRHLSRPFFDTGEHVLFGENLRDLPHFTGSILPQANRGFSIGRATNSGQRATFNYGDIIACGDFYETFREMNSAPYGQLSALHRMIRRSQGYYNRKVSSGSAGRSPNIEWSAAIPEYAELALKNFTHFAPSNGALVSVVRASGMRAKNNRSAWEQSHRIAAQIVRRNPSSNGAHEALAQNAFGDHFLTDAFSAGHLFNKNDFSAAFTANAYSGNRLSAAGRTFIERVADRAFNGDLKRAFLDYDFLGTEVTGGLIRTAPLRVNIRTVSQFRAFLAGVAEERGQENRLGDSIAAKVLHDDLNNYSGGLVVRNAVGDTWQLRGDGTLNASNRDIVRKAVAQSIYNIMFEVGNGKSTAELSNLVWRFVPQPTNETTRIISTMARNYANPTNPRVITRAIEILQSDYQVLLDMAVDAGKLRHDP